MKINITSPNLSGDLSIVDIGITCLATYIEERPPPQRPHSGLHPPSPRLAPAPGMAHPAPSSLPAHVQQVVTNHGRASLIPVHLSPRDEHSWSVRGEDPGPAVQQAVRFRGEG